LEKGWLGEWPGGQPKLLWKANVGTGFASLAVANGRAYTLGNSGKEDTVYCFDAASGTEVWKHSYAQELDPKYYEGGPGSTPTVFDGRVYTVSRHGTALCLDAGTGKVIWRKNLHKDFGCEIPDWGFNGSAHIEGSMVIYNAGSHGVALQRDTGDKVWVSGKEASGYGTPVPFTHQGRRLLAMFSAKALAAVDPVTGTVAWEHPWKTSYDVNAADPVIEGNSILLTSGYGTGAAVVDISGPKPTQRWFNKDLRGQMATPVVIGGYVYGIDGQGDDREAKLKCIDLNTGRVVWQSPAAKAGSLSAADGRLIWITGSGELVVVEAKPDAYKELARAQVSSGRNWTSPVLANGRIYVRNAKGQVVCLDSKGDGATR